MRLRRAGKLRLLVQQKFISLSACSLELCSDLHLSLLKITDRRCEEKTIKQRTGCASKLQWC